MKTKFPLYAKILFWFFLNVLLLVAVFFFVGRAQLRFGLDSLVAGRAGERIQSLTRLITTELRESPREEWDATLKRFGDAYSLQFLLFRNDGTQIAGTPLDLPPEVLEKIRERRGPIGFQRRPVSEPRPRFGEPPPFGPEPPQMEPRPQPAPPPQASMLHTTMPNRYWVLSRVPLDEPDLPRPMPATLVALSKTLGGGGLFFDFTPWIAATVAVILISVAFWFPLVRGITRSISRITNATDQIAEGQFEIRLEDKRRDELGLLGDAVNRMASRLSGFVGGQRKFLGDIAHELCSPIARMQMALGILEQRLKGEPDPHLEDLREEVEHMSNLVNELLSFSKASLGKAKIKIQAVALLPLVAKAVNREAGLDDGANIKVNVPEDLNVLAEPELLLRSVANVLRNAIRYAGDSGPLTISATRENQDVILAIEDCGAGIPDEAIAQIFDPFYRIDSSRSRDTGGVGLGLSIVKTCIESCGGTVTCENRQPNGLRVVIRLASTH